MNKNPNLKIVGFFGQSGAGKTTIIRNVRTPINGQRIAQNTGIIRYLFQKNSNSYTNPVELLRKYSKELEEMKPTEKRAKIDEIYEKYVRSQLQLLNDFSTEVFLATQYTYTTPTILLIDRSPVDFYALTICGLNYLKDKLGRPFNDQCKMFVEFTRKTAEINTQNFFDAITITNPWKASDINKELNDGVRDQYLTEFYTEKNWYGNLDDIDTTSVKLFSIDGSVTDLNRRAEIVETQLVEV